MDKGKLRKDNPEDTALQLRDSVISDSSDGLDMSRQEEDVEVEAVVSMTGAKFEGKKVYLVKDFINSDRISNRNLNALGIVGYLIQITHNGKTWRIYKRRKEFGYLHDDVVAELRKKNSKLGISMPDYKEEHGEAHESMMDSISSHCNYMKSLSMHKDA